MFSNILVALDGSAFAESAVQRAVELAVKVDSQVTFLHVIQTQVLANIYDDNLAVLDAINQIDLQAEQNGVRIVETAAQEARIRRITFHTKLVKGHPSREIIDEATSGGYDLVVLGSRGLGGLKSYLMGSVSSRVSQSAPCSVLIVR